MSTVITKIERTASNSLVYKDTDDNIQFIGNTNAHVRPLQGDRCEMYDMTGKGVNIPYSTFEAVIIEGVEIPFSGTFQEFLALMSSLVTEVGGGGGGAPVETSDFKLIYKDESSTPISTVSPIFQDVFAFSGTLEDGFYELDFNVQVQTEGREIETRILINGTEYGRTSDFSFLFGVQFYVQRAYKGLDLSGVVDIKFQYRALTTFFPATLLEQTAVIKLLEKA